MREGCTASRQAVEGEGAMYEGGLYSQQTGCGGGGSYV